MHAKYRLLSFIIVAFTLSMNAVHAASFDCKLATKTAERVICGSLELSALDEQLHIAYSTQAQQNPTGIEHLQSAQQNWLMHRNACAYSFDCIKATMQSRLRELNPIDTTAYSWGGKLRDKPSLNSVQVGSTREKQQIHVLAQTRQMLDGYPWFKVEVNGKQSYQWGGILCAPSYAESSHCS